LKHLPIPLIVWNGWMMLEMDFEFIAELMGIFRLLAALARASTILFCI